MRQPLQRKPTGTRTSGSTSMPAPLRGWNAHDPKASMRVGDAYELINWFPGTASLEIRRGCEEWVTGFGQIPKTLMTYKNATTEKLFAATAFAIYDVSTSGVLGSGVNAVTNAVWSYTNFTNIAGSWLVAVNGVDKLRLYNGTAWTAVDGASSPAITGVTTTTLETVCLFKRRLWFTQKDSMSLWYLGINSVGGAATEFPVGQIFPLGGKVVAMINWTIDGGAGIDDHFVIISSEGEVAIYKGTDPASDFQLHGVYYAGKPIGNRCFTKFGGDVIILTETGVVTLSTLLADQSRYYNSSLTNRIDGAFAEAVRLYKDNFGWCCVVHPLQNALIVNIPVTASSSVQFVMNTITKFWTKFEGWPAINFSLFGDYLYYTTNTKVVRAWTGASDFGNDIVATCQQAYDYLGARGVLKQFKLIRPILEVDYSIRLELGIDVDFDDRSVYNEVNIARGASSSWDTAEWDVSVWGSDTIVEDNWRTVDSKVGYGMSLRLRVKTKTSIVMWSATDIIYERGGIFS